MTAQGRVRVCIVYNSAGPHSSARLPLCASLFATSRKLAISFTNTLLDEQQHKQTYTHFSCLKLHYTFVDARRSQLQPNKPNT